MTKLTTESLEKFVNDIKTDGMCDITDSQVESVLIRLFAYEQAAKNPVAWVVGDEEIADFKNGREVCVMRDCDDEQLDYLPLYAAPVLPKQPELPQGFTYESGILTANFGNGDILISDTHWPESGHAGISFAPVPQPKRPNLSDYTDLLGGSKTEDIGTLFIVKSNSAESLIAIRNKLDIAISALSPAPAQPVIPEGLIKAINRLLDNDGSRGCFDALEQHRAKTELERLLATAQQNEAQNIPENIPAPLDAQDLELYVDMLENSDSDDEDGELNNTQLIVWLKELQRRRALSAQPVSEPYKLPQGYALVPCKLTAENGAKSCMIGKFIEQTEISCPECSGDDECETCDGSGTIEVTAHVSWKTIKDIWAKGIEHFAAAPAQDSE